MRAQPSALPRERPRAHTVTVDPQPELLGDEPVRLPRRRETDDDPTGRHLQHHRVAWSIAAVVALAGASLAVVDAGDRSRETAALEACERQLQDASDHADYTMGLTTNYVRPVAVGGSGRTHLADLMAPRARKVLPAVQRAHRTCAAVHVRPWHVGLAERQDAATTYAAALVTLLQTVAAQGPDAFDGDRTLLDLRAAAGIDGG